MAANFPNNPNNGDSFTSNGVTFTWNGEAWKKRYAKWCSLHLLDY